MSKFASVLGELLKLHQLIFRMPKVDLIVIFVDGPVN